MDQELEGKFVASLEKIRQIFPSMLNILPNLEEDAKDLFQEVQCGYGHPITEYVVYLAQLLFI